MEDEVDFGKLSVEERCQHKAWKARVSGYEDIAKTFHQLDEKSPEFTKHLPLVKKMVSDSNAAAQEKGLAAVLAFVSNAFCAGRVCGDVVSNLVAKCYSAPKPKTKDLAFEITLMYIEIEKQEQTVEEVLKGLENKNPKTVSACVLLLRESLRSFGSKVINIKLLLKVIPKLLEDRDKTVREETKLLTIELYRWIREAIKPPLQVLKPVQLTELEAEFDKVGTDRAVPIRYLRSQQETQAKLTQNTAENNADLEDADDESVPEVVDTYELLEAVDVLSKLPKDFYEQCESKKWQERKETLDGLLKLVSVPKLEGGDYADLVRALKKIVAKDSNILVVTLAAKCLTSLAIGLRRKFNPFASQCTSVMLEKFKDKKPTVVQALREGVDAIYLTTTLETILEDAQQALENKNPQIRGETALFLTRCFTRCTPAILTKKTLKALCSSFVKTLNDPDPTVRDSAAEALGTAMKVSGDRAIEPFLQEVEPAKVAKVKECCEKAVVVVVKGTKTTKSTDIKKVINGQQDVTTSDTLLPSRSQKQQVPKAVTRPPVANGVVTGFGKTFKKPSGRKGVGNKAAGGVPQKEAEFTEKELSDDEVTEQASHILPDDVISGLTSSNWKDRLSAMEKCTELVHAMQKDAIPAQVLARLLARKPGFKDTNFQVLKLRFELLTTVAECAPISRTTVDSCLADIVDKIGDPKTGSTAAAALTALSEATGLELISQEVLQYAFTQKSPKNQSEALNWLSEAIKEFGLKVNVATVIDTIKKSLAATNPSVRTAAVTLIGVMYLYMGSTLRKFFEDEKPALLQQIDAELAKVQDEKPPAPTRGQKSRENVQSALSDGVQSDMSVASINVADLIPRTDIGELVSQSLLTELADKNWKVRAEALQKLATLLDEAKFVTPNLGELPPALKARMMDSNKNLAVQALAICQTLGTALGPHCNKHMRTLAPGMLAALADSKNAVRNTGLTCLNTWMEHSNLALLFEGETVSDALKVENPYLRTELLGWLAERLPSAKSLPAADVNACIPHLFLCLEDRNADVRKKAQECLLPFMMHTGYDVMSRMAGKLKPASRNLIMPQLDKARAGLPTKPPVPVAAKAKTLRGGSIPGPGRNLSPRESAENAAINDETTTSKNRMNRSASKTRLETKPGQIASKVSKKEEEAETLPPLVDNSMKAQRLQDEKALRVLRWNFTAPREEFYQLLKDQMITGSWGRTLVNNCFHTDFKYHNKALDTLTECLVDIDATIANLDLILKWLALRFFDTNPSVLMKGLEYLQQLFSKLIARPYSLLEPEASSFIPYLIMKVGDPKDNVRKGVREILKQMCEIYPFSKMVGFILQGLASKNARQRTECLEELGSMIESYGLNICQPTPSAVLKEVAKQIADRDNGVRNAALNCVAHAYFLEGEKVYRLIGQLSDKDMSLLEERIKRLGRGRPFPTKEVRENIQSPLPSKTSPQSSAPSSNEAVDVLRRPSPRTGIPRPRSQGPLSVDFEEIEQMFKTTEPEKKLPELVEVNADELLNLPDIQLPPIRLRPPASAIKLLNSSDEASVALNLVMAQLAAQEIPVVVEAFAQVEEVLRQEEKAEALLGTRADQLLLMGALQYRLAHNKHMADENICKADVLRLYRCVTVTLLSLFDHKVLSKRASRDVLRDLIPHLVTVMLDSRLNELQEGPQVVRSINILVVRIIQQGNPTHVMSALIKLLHDCVGSLNASERFTELVMKCLWRMLRIMSHYINELNVDRILLDLHIFLKAYPSSYWKDRKTDTPIRTIKTVLYTLVKNKGEDITKHLVLIPNKQDSDLVIYLNKLLNMKKEGEQKAGHGLRGSSGLPRTQDAQPEGSPTSGRKGKSSPRLSKNTHETLAEIFKKIGSKEQTRVGLEELYEFRLRHPEADIEPFLQRSSEFFQNYIRKGLKNIEHERESQPKKLLEPGGGAVDSSSVLTGLREDVNKMSPNLGIRSTSGGTENSHQIISGTWNRELPPLPPDTEDTTPMDWIDWLKSVTARLGVDGSKYNDPAYLQKMLVMNRVKISEGGLLSEQQMEEIWKGVEEDKALLEDLKRKLYKTPDLGVN